MSPVFIPMSGVVLGVVAASVTAAQPSATPVPYPHPLISEVLYSVPSGQRGDANADGERDAVGDEFIELVNPHDKPIQLKGYTLMDADAYSPGAAKPDPVAPHKPGGTDKPSADKPSTDKPSTDKPADRAKPK